MILGVVGGGGVVLAGEKEKGKVGVKRKRVNEKVDGVSEGNGGVSGGAKVVGVVAIEGEGGVVGEGVEGKEQRKVGEGGGDQSHLVKTVEVEGGKATLSLPTSSPSPSHVLLVLGDSQVTEVRDITVIGATSYTGNNGFFPRQRWCII